MVALYSAFPAGNETQRTLCAPHDVIYVNDRARKLHVPRGWQSNDRSLMVALSSISREGCDAWYSVQVAHYINGAPGAVRPIPGSVPTRMRCSRSNRPQRQPGVRTSLNSLVAGREISRTSLSATLGHPFPVIRVIVKTILLGHGQTQCVRT